MKLYHGTTVDIEQIDLSKSRPNKDFGRAFYLSTEDTQAMEMAQFKAAFEDATPIVNVYEYIKGITFQYAFCTQKAVDKLVKL